MRPEAELWIRQAASDLKNAERNIGIAAFDVAAFLCQQAVEKLLKGSYAQLRREEAPRTHTVFELGRQLKVSEAILSHLRVLTPDYLAARYPDAANGVPAEVYDEPIARDRLRRAKEVFEWARGQVDIELA